MWMRAIKSAEELEVLRAGARFAAHAAAAAPAVGQIASGVVESEVGIAAAASMHRAIAATFPGAGMTGCDARFQSGIHTDGAYIPVTDKRIESGEVLSLTCAPMLFGYYCILQRKLFCEQADKASLCI